MYRSVSRVHQHVRVLGIWLIPDAVTSSVELSVTACRGSRASSTQCWQQRQTCCEQADVAHLCSAWQLVSVSARAYVCARLRSIPARKVHTLGLQQPPGKQRILCIVTMRYMPPSEHDLRISFVLVPAVPGCHSCFRLLNDRVCLTVVCAVLLPAMPGLHSRSWLQATRVCLTTMCTMHGLTRSRAASFTGRVLPPHCTAWQTCMPGCMRSTCAMLYSGSMSLASGLLR